MSSNEVPVAFSPKGVFHHPAVKMSLTCISFLLYIAKCMHFRCALYHIFDNTQGYHGCFSYSFPFQKCIDFRSLLWHVFPPFLFLGLNINNISCKLLLEAVSPGGDPFSKLIPLNFLAVSPSWFCVCC